MRKAEYFLDKLYDGLRYEPDALNFSEFECCTFEHCDFSQCCFMAVTFIDCNFIDCNFSGAKINHVAFRGTNFNKCLIVDVNFAMCNKLIFEISFQNCVLDFSKFYALKIKGTTFSECSMVAVDFMETDLTGVHFENCDLYKTVFIRSIADKADFSTSYNYAFDPEKNKIKKALFSISGLKGLLQKHEITVV